MINRKFEKQPGCHEEKIYILQETYVEIIILLQLKLRYRTVRNNIGLDSSK